MLGEGEKAFIHSVSDTYSAPVLPLAQHWEMGPGGEGSRFCTLRRGPKGTQIMDAVLPPMNPEVARLRRKAAQRKYVKRLRYVRFLWGIAGVLLLLLAVEAVLVLTTSPRFWIYRITVRGGETLTPSEVITLAEVPPHSNFYRLSLRQVAERITRGEPRALRVTVDRAALGVLSIVLEERRPLCRLGKEAPPRYVDGQGILFTRPEAPSPPVPVVEGITTPLPVSAFGKGVTADAVRAVIECLTTANAHSGGEAPLEFARVTLGPTGRMTLVMTQGVTVRLGTPDHLAEKMYVLRNTIVWLSSKGYALNEIEYIDVRSVLRAAGLAADYKLRNQKGARP